MTWGLWGSGVDCAGGQVGLCVCGAGGQEAREGTLRSLCAAHCEASSSHLGEEMPGPHLFAFRGLLPVYPRRFAL